MKTKLTFSFRIKTVRAARTALGIVAGCWLVLFAAAPTASAINYVSAASGNLNVTTIWTPNGTPTVGDTITIQNAHNVTNSAAGLNLAGITINTGGSFTLGTPTTTTGWVLNNGTLRLSAGTTARTLAIGGSITNHGTFASPTTGPTHTLNFTANGFWVGSGDLSAGNTVKAGITVNSGVTLDITGITNSLLFKPSGTIASTISGTLIAGTNVIDLNGDTTHTLTFAAGATLVTANVNGINGTIMNPVIAPVFDPTVNYVFNGAAAQVTAGLAAMVSNLTITNAAGVTLSSATTVNGTLALDSGVLTTSSSATPTNAAVTSQNGAYVSGPLAIVYSGAGSQAFPIGKGGNARSVTLNYTSLDAPSTVTVEQIESAMGGTLPANTSQFASRYWAVSQSGGSVYTYDLTLNGTGFTPSGTARMLQQGSPDTSYSTTFASPNYTATGIASVGNFTLGDFNAASDQLKFTTTAQSITAGAASGTITVQLQTAGGTPKNAVSDLTVNVSTTSAAGVFRDTGDTATITSVTITAGNNSASFKYKDTLAPAMPTITASTGGGITPATQVETINPATANRLVFTTPPVNTSYLATMAPVVVQVEDQYGNLVAQSGTSITLTLGNSDSAVLTGTIPQNTDGTGSATFNDLAVTVAPGNGMTLTATGGSLIQAVSGTFDITRKVVVKAMNPNPMNDGSSWQNPPPPGSDDLAQIDNTSVNANANGRTADIGDNASWYGFNVIGWVASTVYTITDTGGGHAVTLGAGGLTVTNLNNSMTIDAGFVLGASQNWWLSPGNGSLTVNGAIDNGGFLLPVDNAIPLSLNGAVSSAGSLVKTGTNTLTLGGANTFGGNTTVNAGILRFGNNTTGHDGTITSAFLTNNAAVVFNRFGSVSYGGVISGSGTVTMSGSGMQTLSGANTYAGTTTISGGTLLTTKPAALPGYNTPAMVIVNGGTAGVHVGGSGWTTTQVDTLLANAGKTNGALGLDTAIGSLSQWTTFSIANLGPLGLTKLGANTLTLDQVNTYTGNTTVSAGTLALGSSGSINLSPRITVASGATLDVSAVSGGYQVATGQILTGAGTITGPVTVTSGGTLAPGGGTLATLGTMTMSGPLICNAGSTNNFRLSASNNVTDFLTGLSSVQYGGTLRVANLAGTPTLGQSFQLISATSHTGSFDAMNLPALTGSLAWNWNPATGTLTVVQEPAFITNSVSGNTLTLSWSAAYAGWYCQSNSVNLANPSYWFDIPGSESVTTETFTIDATNTNVFFRLRSP